MQQRREAEHDACGDGDSEREDEHLPVERHLRGARDAVRVRLQERSQTDGGEDDTKDPAKDGNDDPLGDELTKHSEPARAERSADGELTTSGVGAGEKEVRQVRARDQENEPDGALEHPERLLDVPDDVVLEVVDPESMILRIGCMVGLRLRLPASEKTIEIHAGLLNRRPALQASDEVEKMTAPPAR